MGFPGAGIPYVPSFNHVGETLKQLAPQIAVEYAHVLWEATNNAKRQLQTRAMVADQDLKILLDLLQEMINVSGLPQPKPSVAPALPQTWGALGDLVFGILTAPESLEVQDGVTYAKQTLIGSKPHLQFSGYELQEIKLPLHWHHLVHPDIEGQMKTLLQAMNDRQVLPLVIGSADGTGLFAGSFVIPRISRQITRHLPDGKIAAVDLTVELLEWVSDPELVMGKAAPAVRPKAGTTPASSAQATKNPDGTYTPMGGN